MLDESRSSRRATVLGHMAIILRAMVLRRILLIITVQLRNTIISIPIMAAGLEAVDVSSAS